MGSLLNTVTYLFIDLRFISKIKEEFINGEIAMKLQMEIDLIYKMYEEI